MTVSGVVLPPSARSFELSILADRISCIAVVDTSELVDCLRFSRRQRTPDAGRRGVPSFDFPFLDAGGTRMSVKIIVSVTELTNMDAKDHYIVEGIALSTATEDVGDGPQGHENDTDAYSLSHLDPPSDGVYMICGVLIAMVLVGVIIVLLAVTISKLRKRDEHHSSTVHPETTVVQTATSPATIAMSSPTHPGDCCTQISTTTTTVSTDLGSNNICDEQHIYAVTTSPPSANPVESFTWQFPPPYPPRHMLPAQYALYNDQDTLVHGLPSDRPGFAKGFRKNLGGRWRRLVKRKAESDTCAIPPELKDQLKSIYVY